MNRSFSSLIFVEIFRLPEKQMELPPIKNYFERCVIKVQNCTQPKIVHRDRTSLCFWIARFMRTRKESTQFLIVRYSEIKYQLLSLCENIQNQRVKICFGQFVWPSDMIIISLWTVSHWGTQFIQEYLKQINYHWLLRKAIHECCLRWDLHDDFNLQQVHPIHHV